MNEVEVNRAAALDGVRHGFLGRRGGVSEGIFATLDLGRRDQQAEAVIGENRRRAIDAVAPGARLQTLYQIHSAEAVTVLQPYEEELRPRADALVTNQPDVLLGILTADCAPVLFADREAGVVGAAHAGWKGALGGITDATIAAMEALGADRTRIVAAIGPCIARASYEVDEGFRNRFLADDAANERFFADGKPGHAWFDLEAYVAHRLSAAGIGRVEALGEDTYAQESRFYSYRRATHRAEPDYGRQVSLIAL